jgi:ketosteroid isomerase-like protein
MDEIQNLSDRMNALVESGDVKQILQILTDGVVFMPPNDTAKVGKENYYNWATDFQRRYRITKVKISSQELVVAKPWAFEWGYIQESYTPRAGGSPFGFDGKFLRIFQQQSDGSWKIARAIWNSIQPIPASS